MELIDSYELMKKLGVCRATLHRWRNKGLPYHQPGGKNGAIRFDESEVKAWMKQNKENSPTDQSK